MPPRVEGTAAEGARRPTGVDDAGGALYERAGVAGLSTSVRPFPGVALEIDGHPVGKMNARYLVTRVEDAIADGQSFSEVAQANRLPVLETPPLTSAGTAPTNPAFRLPPEYAGLPRFGFEMEGDDDPVVETLPEEAGYALLAVGEYLGQRLDRGFDEAHVRGVLAALLRRPHADEVDA